MPKGQVLLIGDQVAFNKLKDATWFDIMGIDGHKLTIREHGTEYAPQVMDDSLVEQHKKGLRWYMTMGLGNGQYDGKKAVEVITDNELMAHWITGDTKLHDQRCRMVVHEGDNGKIFAQLYTDDGNGNGWLVAQWTVK